MTTENSTPSSAGSSAAVVRQDQPLSFTVHAMPVPDASAPSGPHTVAGRWKMLLVLLVCVSPIVASYFTYYVIRPEGRRNFGELIDPQRPLPAVSGRTLDGRVVPLPSLKGQWLLMTVASGACEAKCEKNLYFQRQIRETLGKEKGRVDRVWLVTDDAPIAPALLPALEGATVLRVAAAALSPWLQPENGAGLQNHLYVVDPMGNWMMRFPADLDAPAAARAKRDLDRLLRAAGSWDKEGR